MTAALVWLDDALRGGLLTRGSKPLRLPGPLAAPALGLAP